MVRIGEPPTLRQGTISSLNCCAAKKVLTQAEQRLIYGPLCIAQKSELPQTGTVFMSEVRPTFFHFVVTKMMVAFRFRPFDVEALIA